MSSNEDIPPNPQVVVLPHNQACKYMSLWDPFLFNCHSVSVFVAWVPFLIRTVRLDWAHPDDLIHLRCLFQDSVSRSANGWGGKDVCCSRLGTWLQSPESTGLDKSGYHSSCLDTWSTVGGTIWEGLGSWRWYVSGGWAFRSLVLLLVGTLSISACGSRWELLAVLALLCLPGLWLSETVSPIKCFLNCLGHSVLS